MTSGIKNDKCWAKVVEDEKDRVLASNKTPIQILHNIFILCRDEFDVKDLKNNYSELYDLMQEFFGDSTADSNALLEKATNVVNCFNLHKQEMREFDIQLYYALLNFADMFKSNPKIKIDKSDF